MTGKGTENLFGGFFAATIALGGLIVFAWVALWILGALGGPQLQMPIKLLFSGFGLIVLGYVFGILVKGRAKG